MLMGRKATNFFGSFLPTGKKKQDLHKEPDFDVLPPHPQDARSSAQSRPDVTLFSPEASHAVPLLVLPF